MKQSLKFKHMERRRASRARYTAWVAAYREKQPPSETLDEAMARLKKRIDELKNIPTLPATPKQIFITKRRPTRAYRAPCFSP